MTGCANPACDNPLPARAATGRPAIYCTPACRPNRRRATARPDDTVDDADTVVVELNHPNTSPDGRPPQRVWTLQLRRGPHVVVIAEGLGWPTATALARQLDHLLAPPAGGTTTAAQANP